MALLYGAYLAKLHEGGRDARDRLEKLEENLAASCYADDKDIFLDGFSYFTGRERNILRILLKRAKSVTVTLLGDGSDSELFAEGLRVREQLYALARDAGVPCTEEVLRGGAPRDALGHVEKHFFGGNVRWDEPTEQLRLYEASTAYDEAERIAAEILRLVRCEGYRFRDITVTSRDMDAAEPVLRTVFARCGIPLYCARRSDILRRGVPALLLGALAGFVLTKLETMFRSNSNRLSLSIAFIFLMVGLSAVDFTVVGVDCGFSPLLVCMMLGTVFCNICPLSEDLMDRADDWSAPLLAVFFVISGAELRLEVFGELTMVLIGVIYIIFRSAGKYFGAHFSAKAVGCDEKTVKYLGITLLPQAGVALGMCVTARSLGAEGDLIRNITLFAILIYELVGPLLTKMALQAAGEIHPMDEAVRNRRQHNLEQVNAGKK